MLRNDKPKTIIQLLATLRGATFPKAKVTPAAMACLAGAIAHNCAAIIAFADWKLKKASEDSEDIFSLYEVREKAMTLKTICARASRNAGSEALRKEVETLRMQYDNFSGLVRHMVGLLDPRLQEALDEIL